ncbi:hydrogenase expression/formation protein HypE [Acidiphilium sp.]|uniref:hydrogenase expression/formation protein HypE n=1 Tax=Acidiphilium sp. TaxID=527 RepID=UPI0025830883|nr:hydrogenase expression/formation protein HypE [Acidiphilium sp.]
MSGPACPRPAAEDGVIEPGHGGGGALTARLIADLFLPCFGEAPSAPLHDGATLTVSGARLAFTTDSFVVTPLEFPGGDIGALAVIGTVNDLAMCGARPFSLSAGFILEEGLEIARLRRIAASMGRAAAASGVRVVTGDTKVVARGKGDGIYITTAGIGLIPPGVVIGPQGVRPGDAVLLSGDIGRHGIAVMAAREGLGFEPAIESDLASLAPLVTDLIEAGVVPHCLRDLTRGGLASALVEIAAAAGVDLLVDTGAVPVCEAVQGACEILGLDPWYVANEGRLVAFVAESQVARALDVLRRHSGGACAALIGRVAAAPGRGRALAATLGGVRVLDLPSGEQLPRIC